MGIYKFKGKTPKIGDSFVAKEAALIGDVTIGDSCSIWFNATLRADYDAIIIGNNTNVQDGTVIHNDYNKPVIIGDNVTIGHNAIIHACQIEDNVIIGMGSTILDDVIIPKNCIIGANSLITKTAKLKEGSLILGSPARILRSLTEEEINNIEYSSKEYIVKYKEFIKENFGGNNER